MFVLRLRPMVFEVVALPPPAYSAAYIKATNNVFDMDAYKTLDPNMPLAGDAYPYCWMSGLTANLRYHIAFSQARTIKKIIYCNYHNAGYDTNRGVNSFTLQGSNSESSFNNLNYGTNTGWVDLSTDTNQMVQHTHTYDGVIWKEINVLDENPVKYIAIKCNSNHGGSYMGLRRVQVWGY